MSNEPKHHEWSSWIGTDESGKGDYFGSLVVAGMAVTPEICEELRAIGVRDSKKLSIKKIDNLSGEIWNRWQEHVSWIELDPFNYNARYSYLKKHGGTLTNLLAELHKKVIENLVNSTGCRRVIVDRFTNKKTLENLLKDLPIELIQVPKAESDIAVAAASVIARQIVLKRFTLLSERYGLELVRGMSRAVECGKELVQMHGSSVLSNVAKLHFKTTKEILGANPNH